MAHLVSVRPIWIMIDRNDCVSQSFCLSFMEHKCCHQSVSWSNFFVLWISLVFALISILQESLWWAVVVMLAPASEPAAATSNTLWSDFCNWLQSFLYFSYFLNVFLYFAMLAPGWRACGWPRRKLLWQLTQNTFHWFSSGEHRGRRYTDLCGHWQRRPCKMGCISHIMCA